MDGQDRRIYQRGFHFHTEAQISRDGKNWVQADINDVSLSGLQLLSDDHYNVGDVLWFHLVIQGFFTEFEIKVQGTVRRERAKDGRNIYGVSFIGLSEDLKVMIDENVRNDRPVNENPYSMD